MNEDQQQPPDQIGNTNGVAEPVNARKQSVFWRYLPMIIAIVPIVVTGLIVTVGGDIARASDPAGFLSLLVFFLGWPAFIGALIVGPIVYITMTRERREHMKRGQGQS